MAKQPVLVPQLNELVDEYYQAHKALLLANAAARASEAANDRAQFEADRAEMTCRKAKDDLLKAIEKKGNGHDVT